MAVFNSVIGDHIITLQSIGSTNEYLQAEIKKGVDIVDGTVIVARHQFAGKGLETNKWESAPGKNLILSVFLKPAFLKAQDQFMLNKMVSLSVLDFINSISTTTSNKVKWPNDIYMDDKKVSGILINNTIGGNDILFSIIGIGINVNQQAFESDAPNPVSLTQIVNIELELDRCLNSLISFLNIRYQQMKSSEIQKINTDYLNSLYRYNEYHFFYFNNCKIKARIIGLGEYGKLKLIREDQSTIECDMKEIQFIL
ncbi:MAG: biotin--[acetyl-CoA-carboxylase] ligase [Bacteroidales bacterium]